MTDNHNNDDYKVGYAKPPEGTKFSKGKSGNPKGRPKGSKNVASIVHDAAQERVKVTIGGRVRWMSKLQMSVMQLSTKAANGDLKAARELKGWLQTFPLFQDLAEEETKLQQRDQEVLEHVIERIRASNPAYKPPQTSPVPPPAKEKSDENH